jgi:hypothetical protein
MALQTPKNVRGLRVARFFLVQRTKTEKSLTIWPQNIPKVYETYRIVVIYSKWLQNIPTLSIPKPSKIYPMEIFGLKIYLPSGNPEEVFFVLQL